jgi:hypothetical protein
VDNDAGGDARFDVYVGDIINKDFALGEEVPEGDLDGGKRSTAYLLMDNDFRNSGFSTPISQLIEMTAAHEFHHAIQDNYDSKDQFTSEGLQNFWYYEATSSWMENQVYPNDQKAYIERLPTWFRFPEMPLDFWDPFSNQFGDHGNGSAIFNYFLRDNYGVNVVREIWETLAYRPGGGTDLTSIQAIDTALRQRGSNLTQGLKDFFTWNYITGARSDGQHYKDASFYPNPYVDTTQTHTVYPVTSGNIPYPPDHFGSNYVQFNNNGAGSSLTVNFDGQDGVLWVVRLIATRKGTQNSFTLADTNLDSFGKGQLVLPDWQNYSRAVMVVGVATTAGNNYRYAYSAQVGGSGSPQTGSLTFNFLNGWNVAGVPFNLSDQDPVTWFGSALRFVVWDPTLNGNQGGYRFYSGPGSVQLSPGAGYFVSSNGSRQVSLTNQPIPDQTQPFSIPLPVRNWVLFANPFLQPVTWDVDSVLYSQAGARRCAD